MSKVGSLVNENHSISFILDYFDIKGDPAHIKHKLTFVVARLKKKNIWCSRPKAAAAAWTRQPRGNRRGASRAPQVRRGCERLLWGRANTFTAWGGVKL